MSNSRAKGLIVTEYRLLNVPCNSGIRVSSVWFFIVLQTKAESGSF